MRFLSKHIIRTTKSILLSLLVVEASLCADAGCYGKSGGMRKMDRDERSIPNLSISMEVNKFNKYPKYTHINELIIVIPCRQTVNFCVSYRISFDLYKQN